MAPNTIPIAPVTRTMSEMLMSQPTKTARAALMRALARPRENADAN
jgi:hypothetical protein